MNKLIFTTLRGRTVSVLASEKRVLLIEFEGEEAAEQIGTIYIGKVRNVVKNLNAAFVEYKPGVNGYYSLNDNQVHTFADGKRENRPLKSGDEIVVQIARAAVKMKDAVLSGELNLTGRYTVVTNRGEKFGISAKIKDKKWREAFKEEWDSAETPDCGVIIRTNAYGADFSDVLADAVFLNTQLKKIQHDAAFRTPYSVLYRPDSFALAAVRDANMKDMEEVVTDIPGIYEELKESTLVDVSVKSSGHNVSNTISDTPRKPFLRLYDDSYPLTALYQLESSLDKALAKNVWLKSGGYLVIEPTEAMTVIDVNTGKNIDKKSPEETYFNTNMEAAAEIAAQMRLRNLSGIIIVDFIDMAEKSHNEELLSTFKRYLAYDPVKTVLVDMTALGLVEVTRKKVKRPLYEQVR